MNIVTKNGNPNAPKLLEEAHKSQAAEKQANPCDGKIGHMCKDCAGKR